MESAPRQILGSYGTYAEAEATVDSLADRGFPVERLSIVAEDLRFVEHVTGRAGYGTAAVNGFASGGLIGAFIGFLLGLFSLVNPLVSGLALAVWGFLFGAVAGLILSLIGHALSRGRRNFSSVGAVQAGRYAVVCDAEVANEAQDLLTRASAGSAEPNSAQGRNL